MRISTLALLLLTVVTTTACYRMPTADDYSVNPMTNSRDFNQEGENPLVPNMSY